MSSGVEALAGSLVDGTSAMVDELATFVDTTVRPNPTEQEFLSEGGTYHAVASFSVALLVGFIVLGVIHGLLTGEPGQALVRLVRDVPLAVLAILGFPWLVGLLVGVCDGLSATVLPSGDTLRQLVRVQVLETARSLISANAVPAMLVSLLTYLGTLLIYLELLVRVVLLRMVEAMAPLSFAPLVWPPARGAARKVFELTAALLLSEPVIFLALREGLGFLEDHATSTPGSPSGWGKLLLGLAVLTIAVFAPWVLWRLIPHAEAMLAAQGLSRGPWRGAMQGLQTAYWAEAVSSRWRSKPQPSTQDTRSGSSGGPGPARSLPTPPSTGPRRTPRTPAATPTPGGSGAAGAATGVAVVAAAAKASKDRTVSAADHQLRPPGGDGGPPAAGGPPPPDRPPGPPSAPPGPPRPPSGGGGGGGGGSGAAPGWSRRKPPPPPPAP